jgi:hypothetical protein
MLRAAFIRAGRSPSLVFEELKMARRSPLADDSSSPTSARRACSQLRIGHRSRFLQQAAEVDQLSRGEKSEAHALRLE